MVHLHMRIQVLQSTREKPPDTDLEYKCNTNVFFVTTADPSTMNEGKHYSNLWGRFPITFNKVNKYIYVMYVYGFNAILKTAMKNRSNKEKIQGFA